MGKDIDPWLSRFERPVLLRHKGSFSWYRTREITTGAARVVVVGSSGTDAKRVAHCLDNMAHIHELVAGNRIPRVAVRDRHEGIDFLAFACDAVTDAEGLTAAWVQTRQKLDYGKAAGFITDLMKTLDRAHTVLNPQTEQPIALGSLCTANILLAPSGDYWLLGFGHNPATQLDTGQHIGGFFAPEIAAGAHPSPGADLFAIMLFARGFIPLIAFPKPALRVLREHPIRTGCQLYACYAWANKRVLSALPGQRAGFAEALATYRRALQLLGLKPDLAGWQQWVGYVLGDSRNDLVIGPEGEWLQTAAGARHSLRRRKALRHIVTALGKHAQGPRRQVLSIEDLATAGWPGESILPTARANRVYVALAALRNMGMRELLQRHDGGYRIAPQTRVTML